MAGASQPCTSLRSGREFRRSSGRRETRVLVHEPAQQPTTTTTLPIYFSTFTLLPGSIDTTHTSGILSVHYGLSLKTPATSILHDTSTHLSFQAYEPSVSSFFGSSNTLYSIACTVNLTRNVSSSTTSRASLYPFTPQSSPALLAYSNSRFSRHRQPMCLSNPYRVAKTRLYPA